MLPLRRLTTAAPTPEAEDLYVLQGFAAEDGLWEARTNLVGCEVRRQFSLVHRTAAESMTKAFSQAWGSQGSPAHLSKSDPFWGAESPVAGSTSWP